MRGDGSVAIGSADRAHSKSTEVDIKKAYLRMYEFKNNKEKLQGQLRTMFAVGGWENSQYFSTTARSESGTTNFINSALEIIETFGMDGIDIDWEYPVGGGATTGVAEDKQNYISFLKKIRNALNNLQRKKGRDEKYLLTIAGAAGSLVLEPGFDLTEMAQVLDWINVMTYDYFGAWESKWGLYTGPHAPLYFGAPLGTGKITYSGKTNVDYTMKYYSCRGVPPEKLTMGIGFYGRFWNNSGEPVTSDNQLWRIATSNAGGFEPWINVRMSYENNPAFTKVWDKKTQTPYMLRGDFLLVYENPPSIQAKVQYAAGKNFGGIMIWAVDLDDAEHTMLKAATNGDLCTNGGGASYKCAPISEQRWWTAQDEDGSKAGMCGKKAPLYKGYYPVCDPEDPGFACCSPAGYCGSDVEKFCRCEGCVDYYTNPDKVLEEPVKPRGSVRWHTLDNITPGPQCGYEGKKLPNGDYSICNPDDTAGGNCCSASGYCGRGTKFCDCPGCIDFGKNPNFKYPPKTWSDTGKCGYNPELTQADYVNGKRPTCSPFSEKYSCCSTSGYCGGGADFCDCKGCINFMKNPNFVYPEKTWIDSGPEAGKCGKNARVNGQPATCYPDSASYHCCSASGYCGNGAEFCTCNGCVDYSKV